MNYSQTQISNFMTAAGVLLIIFQKAGVVVSQDQIAFVIMAVWTVGWTVYNFYQRFKKGDIELSGKRKVVDNQVA